MKKVAATLLITFVMLFSQPANADIKLISSSLSIRGTTAACTATIEAPAQEICATLELWCGEERLAVWQMKGQSSLTLTKYAAVSSGGDCSLTVKGTIGGNEFAPVTIVQSA